jgi:hypothetical protein
MRRVAITLAVISVFAAVPLTAQQRPRYDNRQGIPPGQMPPPGQCRVWYEGRPPGQQPRPTNCDDAERIASRNRNARVIYGSSTRGEGWWGSTDPGRGERYPGRGVYQDVAYRNGYDDGYEKGEEDARDNDRYDPVRHGRYRSADHGYESRYGSKEQYKNVYRDGFRAGYDAGYRDWNVRGTARRRAGSIWPF